MLQDKTEYKNGRGDNVTIIGPTKDYPEYVYSLQGNWYERSTGRFLFYDYKKNTYYTHETTGLNIELPPQKGI